jgi:hypothetical protein
VVGAATTIYSCLVKNLICDLEVGATKKWVLATSFVKAKNYCFLLFYPAFYKTNPLNLFLK